MKKEESKLNGTQGKELIVPCQSCAGKTWHKVQASLDTTGSEGDDNWHFSWDVHYQIIQCQGCKSISYRSASSNSEDYEHIDQDTIEYTVTEEIYPPRTEGRAGLSPDVVVYLPGKVGVLYSETLQALVGTSPILAGIGLRALVETVCNDRQAVGANLVARIDDSVVKQVLTPNGARILHKIRTLGNAAAHEAKPHDAKQLALAMDVVEHLLRDVYIIPKQIESEFEDVSGRGHR